MEVANHKMDIPLSVWAMAGETIGSENLKLEDASERTGGDKTNGLLVNNVNSRSPLGTLSSPNGEALKAALLYAADEFELRYTQAFSDLSSKFHITPATAYNSFEGVMDELFRDGVNWGRIVGLFVFGGTLCVECVEKDMVPLVSPVADWMTLYLDNHIEPWIQSQGGWDEFTEIFGRDAAKARRSQETLRRWLLVGVMLLSGALLCTLIVKKGQ